MSPKTQPSGPAVAGAPDPIRVIRGNPNRDEVAALAVLLGGVLRGAGREVPGAPRCSAASWDRGAPRFRPPGTWTS
jgi:hypothetical protein